MTTIPASTGAWRIRSHSCSENSALVVIVVDEPTPGAGRRRPPIRVKSRVSPLFEAALQGNASRLALTPRRVESRRPQPHTPGCSVGIAPLLPSPERSGDGPPFGGRAPRAAAYRALRERGRVALDDLALRSILAVVEEEQPMPGGVTRSGSRRRPAPRRRSWCPTPVDWRGRRCRPAWRADRTDRADR